MEGDGRPTTEVAVAWCGCGGRGVHLTPPHEGKTISMRGDYAACPYLCDCAPPRLRRASRQSTCRRSNYYTYLPLGCGSKTPLISLRFLQRLAGLPDLSSQSAFRLSSTTSL